MLCLERLEIDIAEIGFICDEVVEFGLAYLESRNEPGGAVKECRLRRKVVENGRGVSGRCRNDFESCGSRFPAQPYPGIPPGLGIFQRQEAHLCGVEADERFP